MARTVERIQDLTVTDPARTSEVTVGGDESSSPASTARRRDPVRSAAEDVVRLEQVSKIYPGTKTPAVDNIDLVIQPGEFYSLLGPSGSGKTTTLRMIAGFERPTAGRVFLGETEITRRPPYKRPIHTVFQSYALFPHLNVRQNVGYPLRMAGVGKGEIKSRVQEFLERVAVADFADRMPHQLSGGQRQRVALARALIAEPQLVLLDEPLGALDLKLRQEMQVVLQHIQREVGITFVYVTHDQGEALAMSDHIAIMADGRVHQIGTPQDVYSRPATPFVARFVGSTNLLDCTGTGAGRASAGSIDLEVADVPDTPTYSLSVRPEAIRLGGDADGCDNRLEGVVEEAIYQGSDIQLRIRVGEHLVKARGDVGSFGPGEKVAVGWNRADAVGIAPEAEPAAAK
ncbi:MAG: ABC transporter ATP-binding protein [Actinobacteria bacterium]|nr:ABC transporter ATP-binding protein [Actinomycetota bacterium]